jgi:hypothetical protein
VLHLTIPVAEQARPRRISVGHGESSQLAGGGASGSGGGTVLRGETVGGSTSDSRPDEAAGGADVDLTRNQPRVDTPG